MPYETLPDTIFKFTAEVPAVVVKSLQPVASGEQGPIAASSNPLCLPEGVAKVCGEGFEAGDDKQGGAPNAMHVQVYRDNFKDDTLMHESLEDGLHKPMKAGGMNDSPFAVMPEGWKLAPKNRLPKPLKKELRGLTRSPLSEERPNYGVVGPVPGSRYEQMVLPIAAPYPNLQKGIFFDKYIFHYGGNSSRGQVYPEGTLPSAVSPSSSADSIRAADLAFDPDCPEEVWEILRNWPDDKIREEIDLAIGCMREARREGDRETEAALRARNRRALRILAERL